MDSSDLSDINEVIADSEDEGLQPVDIHKDTNSAVPQSHTPITGIIPDSLPQNQAHTSLPSNTMAVQIDYFAGFQDDQPAPSIAERAKMRQRKPRTRLVVETLELTDDDEFMLGPQATKSKKHKPKKKPKDISPTTPDTGPSVTNPPESTAQDTTPLLNAKPKVRPRPAKKANLQPTSPIHRISQSTLPVSTSPFPLAPAPPLIPPSTSTLPPSSPLLTSPAATDKENHLPPIECLPPPPATDSDAAPSSSFPGVNLDEIYTPSKKKKKGPASSRLLDELADDHDRSVPPAPPTFFAASSSSPVVNVPTAPTIQAPPEIVDLTDLPPTNIEPSVNTVGPAEATTKTNKPSRTRKVKVNDDIINKKRKGKAKQLEVLVPAPPTIDQGYLVRTVPKRRGKQKEVDNKPLDEEEDELNIGSSHNHIDNDVFVSDLLPSSARSLPKSVPTSLPGSATGGDEVPGADLPKPNKRKGRKRKSDLTEADSPSTVTISPNKRKKSSETGEGKNSDRGEAPTRRSPKRREAEQAWKEDEGYPAKVPRVVKSRGKMVITSDDEDDAQPVPDEVAGSFHKGAKTRRGTKVSEDHKDETSDNKNQDEGGLKGDRNALKEVQPTTTMISSSAPNNTPRRCETLPVSKYPSITSQYTIAPRTQTPSMSDLIRRVNSLPSSPFPADASRGSPIPGLAYSPYLKSSRRTLARIAPLHPNRQMPPPPPPPAPPKKKSKKELETEEKWEEEIIEDIGGITEWLALSESEKKNMKRMKRDREMGYCED